MIILITASLSSNTYNKASLREECTFEEIKSTLSRSSIISWDFSRFWSLWGTARMFVHKSLRSWLLWHVFPWRIATIRSHKSSAGIPSNLNPASKEMISDSVELCETEVCFLHIQLIGTNAWLPKMHNVPPEVDFESSRSPAKSESWNSPSLHCLAVFPTWQYCLYSLVKRDSRSSQALVHFVIDCASLFSDYRILGFPTRAKIQHFRTIWEHTFWQVSHGFHFFFLEMMVVNGWSWYFVELLSRFVRQLTISFHTFPWHDLPCRRTTKKYENFPSIVIFQLLQQKFWIQTWFGNCQKYLCLFHIVFQYSTHDRGKMLVLPINSFV